MPNYRTTPAGYRLTVKSWENDADDHAIETIPGLTKSQVSFYVEVCKLHESGTVFANMYEPSELQRKGHQEAIVELALKYDELNGLDVNDVDEVGEFVCDYLAKLDLNSYEFYTRVCDYYIVEYIPEDIKILDVTSDFM